MAVDRFDRLSLKNFLSNDPWFNDFGNLPDVFEERVPNVSYHANEVTEAYATSVREEDNTKIQLYSQNSKRLHIQDINEEKKRGCKVPKTVIYHITNASTYFTGTAPHSSQNPINLDAQKMAKVKLHNSILVTLKQIRLQQVHNIAELGSPISHLFRKFKRTDQERQLRKTSSALNLSQLYQRVTKDHITYFTMQCKIRTASSTTFVSGYSTSSTFASSSTAHTIDRKVPARKKLSNRLSMVFFSNTQPEFSMPCHHDEADAEQDKRNQSEMIRIIRMVCDILGITYYQSSCTQLVCLLALKNSRRHVPQPPPTTQPPQSHSLFRSKMFGSNDRLSDLNRKHGSFISNQSNYSTSSPGWWSRQVHRLSAQFNFSNVDNSTPLFNASSHAVSSSQDLLNIGRIEQEQQILQQNEDEQEEEDISDGFVTLSIDVSSIPSSKFNDDGSPVQVVSLRYSKIKGSSKVFKLAKGWIQKLLSQNNEHKQNMMTRSDAEAYIESVDLQQFDTQENDVVRL